MQELLADGIPAGPVMNLEQISKDEHIAGAREMFVTIDHPVFGKVKTNGNPIKLSKTKVSIRMLAPILGQHNSDILERLGYSKDELASFKETGVI